MFADISSSLVRMPGWGWMWCQAISIYAGLKLATLRQGNAKLSLPGSLAYLLLWPGMNPSPFVARMPVSAGTGQSVLAGLGFMFAGTALWLAASHLDNILLRGWLVMIGMLCLLHFGLFAILAHLWRRNGIAVEPIMNEPWNSASLAEFWGRRWNLAFRDANHLLLFRPLCRNWGPSSAMATGFLVSGIIHDAVISLPAGGGYGGPTLYFILQWLAIVLQKRLSRPWSSGIRGRALTAAVVLLPAPLLFHRPFLENVMIPFANAVAYLFPAPADTLIDSSLPNLLRLTGGLHFGILIASALVPQVLDWKRTLATLPQLVRELFWVHGAFIVLTIVGLGTITLVCADELATRTLLARCFTGFAALFWGLRLTLQFVLFRPDAYLTTWYLRAGYHGLTIVFAILTAIYFVAALK